MECMKVIKRKSDTKPVFLHLKKKVVEDIDSIAKKNKVTRQDLIGAILERSLKDKSLTIEL